MGLIVIRKCCSFYPATLAQAEEIRAVRGITQFSDMLARLIEEEFTRRQPEILRYRVEQEQLELATGEKSMASMVKNEVKKALSKITEAQASADEREADEADRQAELKRSKRGGNAKAQPNKVS